MGFTIRRMSNLKGFLVSFLFKLLAESKRVVVLIFVVSAFLLTAIILQRMGAPESAVTACIASAGSSATLSLPFLLNGITRTDITEAGRLPPAAQAPATTVQP